MTTTSSTSPILGIDLGTTNSAFAVMEAGDARILENAEGARTTPSIVAVKSGERFVGQTAKNQSITNPKNTIFSAKRFIGHKFSEVKAEAERMPFDVTSGANGAAEIVLDGKARKPEEISAMVLQKIKADAEAKLGRPITEAVITVPAYFDDAQRQATKDAGRIAGLNVQRIINEPTAAALAYGLDKKKDEKVAVFDLGGGTFDVSILDIADGTFEVLATNGDTHLGGDNFDEILIDHLRDEFRKSSGIDLSGDPLAMQRLKDEAEKAKKELSSKTEVEINAPFITSDATGPKHLQLKVSRAKFEALVDDLLRRLRKPCEAALRDAGLKASDIHEVLLVGGMSRMPAVRAVVKEIFGKEPNATVNPDEVVAMGAAIQGGVLRGDVKDVLLLDVTPLTLGIETMGGVRTALITRNTTIPTSKSQVFSTAADGQPSVEIHVLQGEREMAADNKSLGRFILDGIAPAPRGAAQIEVTFDLDSNGILAVTAKDKGTGKEQKITIQGSTGMSKEEIDAKVREAEAHAEEDRAKREAIDARNHLDGAVFQAEKMLRDSGEKLSAEAKSTVESAVAEAKEMLENSSASKDELEAAGKALSEKVMKVGEELYKASQVEGSPADTGPSDAGKTSGPDEAEVVDDRK